MKKRNVISIITIFLIAVTVAFAPLPSTVGMLVGSQGSESAGTPPAGSETANKIPAGASVSNASNTISSEALSVDIVQADLSSANANTAQAGSPSANAETAQSVTSYSYASEGADISAEAKITPAAVKIVKVKAPKKAKGVYAMDVVTGKTLSSKNANVSRPVASTSKLMTAWLVHEKIASGSGKWSDKVLIRDALLDKMSRTSPYGGTIRLKKGTYFTVKELYRMTLVESHNAASVQLGRWISGTDKEFAKLMNEAAVDLGMENSYFVNACGLENIDYHTDLNMPYVGKLSDTNMMSPKDAAKLASALVTTYPNVLKTTKLAKVKVKGKIIHNSNHILDSAALKKKAKGLNVDGLKTGFINVSGHCFIGTCEKNGRHRIVTVILNDATRFEDTISLMKSIYKANPKAV